MRIELALFRLDSAGDELCHQQVYQQVRVHQDPIESVEVFIRWYLCVCLRSSDQLADGIRQFGA